jgi:hypothetical protein
MTATCPSTVMLHRTNRVSKTATITKYRATAAPAVRRSTATLSKITDPGSNAIQMHNAKRTVHGGRRVTARLDCSTSLASPHQRHLSYQSIVGNSSVGSQSYRPSPLPEQKGTVMVIGEWNVERCKADNDTIMFLTALTRFRLSDAA